MRARAFWMRRWMCLRERRDHRCNQHNSSCSSISSKPLWMWLRERRDQRESSSSMHARARMTPIQCMHTQWLRRRRWLHKRRYLRKRLAPMLR